MAKKKAAYKKLKLIYKDIERLTIEDDQEVTEVIDENTQRKIIKQVNDEYTASFDFNEAKRAMNLARLRLYNNQRRNQDAVGDPLMFTVFNTIHAALYDDRLLANWEGRGGQGDDDIEENLNALAEFDYDVMGKSEIDYFWNWDAEFFGRGLLLNMDFDRTEGIMAPTPELIDAATFIRDPKAKSVNGDTKGRGSMRFGGFEVGAGYWDLKKAPGYFNVQALRKGTEIQSLLKEARDARSLAQGTTPFEPNEESLGKHDNYEFTLLNWFTKIKGEKYLVTLGNQRSVLIRMIKLDYNGRWPIIDRSLYPMSNDWDGVSIPDLTEDKQRAKAILLNLGLKSAKSDAMPQYLYDADRIKNKNDLNWRHDKFIEVNGRVDNAIAPVNKSTVHQYVEGIMGMLDSLAQRATATPEIQQGAMTGGSKTLGELELVSSKVDTRYSMSAKVFGWSERDFWRQWYQLYKKHFKDKIDEKIVRVQGALSPIWRPFTRENIISNVDPDLKIESKVISESKRQRDQQSFTAFAGLALQNPDADRQFIERKLAKLNGMSKEELEVAFPPTVDEIQAEMENEVLNAEKLPTIGIDDDHRLHRRIHAKANQNAQSVAHIRQHEKLMVTKRNNPELAAPPVEDRQITPAQGQPQRNPSAQPAPTTATQ